MLLLSDSATVHQSWSKVSVAFEGVGGNGKFYQQLFHMDLDEY